MGLKKIFKKRCQDCHIIESQLRLKENEEKKRKLINNLNKTKGIEKGFRIIDISMIEITPFYDSTWRILYVDQLYSSSRKIIDYDPRDGNFLDIIRYDDETFERLFHEIESLDDIKKETLLSLDEYEKTSRLP